MRENVGTSSTSLIWYDGYMRIGVYVGFILGGIGTKYTYIIQYVGLLLGGTSSTYTYTI